MESEEAWDRRRDLTGYMLATPLGRFFINRARRRFGKPPLRARDARRELGWRW
ncbi:MAG TPA: hypothetical protein VGR28_01135 [Candidatus Thermoplasmatota archaeon]|nr:hypothetical protein [Candidatus Thermoplasmatota archaeon]